MCGRPDFSILAKSLAHETNLLLNQVTVLACVSARGYSMSPLVIFKSQTP